MDATEKLLPRSGAQFAPFAPPPGALARPRLLARLQGAERRHLTLIIADSGYGKTTLLAQWGATLPPVAQAWYALRTGDAKPRLVERRLVAALSPFIALHRPARMLDDALDGLEREVLLVLDDAQQLDGGAPLLRRLLDHPLLHLVLASRVPPDLPLARLRLQGQAVELTASDLAFTEEEVAAMALPGDPAELWTRTQGWPAALALVQFGGAPHPAASQQELFNLLAEEVWSGFSSAQRQILESAVVAGTVTAQLAEALSGRSDAGDALESFARRGWLSRTPQQRYQVHSLFREFALQRMPTDQRASLAERAMQWWIDRTEPEEAGAITGLCTAPVRWRFLTQYGSLLARSGGANAIRELLHDLAYDPQEPAEVTTMRGRLENLEGHFAEAQRWLKLAQDRAAQTENWRFLARSSAYEAEILGHRGEYAKSAMTLRTALARIDGRDPEAVAEVEGFLAWFLFHVGKIDEALTMLERARSWFEQHGHMQQEAILIRRRGAMHSTRGELAEALRWEGLALTRFRQLREPLGEANVAMNIGETMLRAGRYEEARAQLQAALAIAERHGLAGMVQQIQLALAGVAASADGPVGPVPAALESERDLFFWHLISARVARRRGESHTAWQELGAARALLPHLLPGFRVRLEVEEAALLLMQEEIEAAVRILEPAVEDLWQAPWRVESYLPRLHRAYARLRLGQQEGAKADLAVLFEWRTQADLGALWSREAWAAVPVLEFAKRVRFESGFASALLSRLAPGREAVAPGAIRVEILGPTRVLRNGQALGEDAFARPQVRALLGHLAVHHPRAVPASELVEALWPHASSIEESSLYTTVSRLRRALGREVVIKDGSGYRLSQDIEVDAHQFTGAVAAHPPRWQEALGLWRGDLLADLPLAEWCFVARDTYRNRFLEAATRYGESSLTQKDYETARLVFERALEIDSTCEPAVQGLMRVLVLTGHAPRALRLFQRFTETLERELGLAPSEETLLLAQRLAG